MTVILIFYAIVAFLVLGILLASTSASFVFIDGKTKVVSVIVEFLAAVLWFPSLFYIFIWTIIKRVRGENLQD